MASFADIPVSTQTFTVRSNIQHIELQRFYEELQPMDPDATRAMEPDGRHEAAILCVKYQQSKKGCDPEKDLKTKRKRTVAKEPPVPKRSFLNCITLIIQIEKRINIKLLMRSLILTSILLDHKVDQVNRF